MLWPSKKALYNIRKRRREFKDHLKSLLRHMRRHELKGLILIIDTVHRSRETRLFLERHREIKPFYLPKYSPSLNEVEGRTIRMLKKIYAQTTHTKA